MATKQEQDQETVRNQMQQNIKGAYDLLVLLVEGTMELKHCGYKSIEDATISIISSTRKENEKLMRAFEKKYPL